MTRAGADTQRLVTFLITALVDDPEAVRIGVTEDGDEVRFRVTLPPSEVGKVIGRNGRINTAIRTLARAAGSTEGRRVEVDVVD